MSARMKRREFFTLLGGRGCRLVACGGAHLNTQLIFEERKRHARIVHIAIKVDDLEKATKFMKRCSAFAKPAQDTRAGMSRDT